MLDLLVIVENPSRFTEALLDASDEDSSLGGVTRGLFSFLNFCGSFDLLLDRARGVPLLRSAMWFYHAYWFNAMGPRVSEVIDEALQRISRWPLPGMDATDIDAFSRATSSSLRRLTAKDNADPLQDASAAKYPPVQTELKLKHAANQFDVLLIYGAEDQPEIERIAKSLMKAGIRPWFDRWELAPGTPWLVCAKRMLDARPSSRRGHAWSS